MPEKQLPDLRSIRAPRHPGMTRATCECYAEAADVCLNRHHGPCTTQVSIRQGRHSTSATLTWTAPDEVVLRAWNNRDDATRDAAYIISFAAIEAELGLVAISRAETKTGADYYIGVPDEADIGMPGDLNLESAYRLEVSGIDVGNEAAIDHRLRQKVEQARRGKSNLPAYASVVGFQEALIMIQSVENMP